MPIARAEVAVIGAGPAGLMAAEVLAAASVAVTVYDQMPSAGRKFLLAGRGGLNLTHSEPIDKFFTRYGAATEHLCTAIEAFPPAALRDWCETLGQPTFVGSSGRVFPQAMKASPLLRAWLRRLVASGVVFKLRHRWQGWDGEGRLVMQHQGSEIAITPAATVLALGGASWPHLGSDGAWRDLLAARGVAVTPLRPANAGFNVAWSEVFRTRFAGQPLKTIALSFGGVTVRGEAIITSAGIEGGAVYALAAALREVIADDGEAMLTVALRPELAYQDIVMRLGKARGKQSLSTYLRKALHLAPVAIGLLQEAAIVKSMRLSEMTPSQLADLINALPIRLTGVFPIARAISSAGGISFDELDDGLMLKRLPGVFAAGEMLDWEAPTGGYLLQGSFATGAAAGRGVLRWLQSRG